MHDQGKAHQGAAEHVMQVVSNVVFEFLISDLDRTVHVRQCTGGHQDKKKLVNETKPVQRFGEQRDEKGKVEHDHERAGQKVKVAVHQAAQTKTNDFGQDVDADESDQEHFCGHCSANHFDREKR